MLKCNNANATLYYDTFVVEEIQDPYLEPKSVCKTQQIKVSIEDISHNHPSNLGTKRDTLVLSGRCISPKRMPPEVIFGRDYDIEWSVSSNQTQRSRGYLKTLSTSRLGLDGIFGDYVEIEVQVAQ